MKVWPIDPLVPRNLRLEVPEKLPQGCDVQLSLWTSIDDTVDGSRVFPAMHLVLGMPSGPSRGDAISPRTATLGKMQAVDHHQQLKVRAIPILTDSAERTTVSGR